MKFFHSKKNRLNKQGVVGPRPLWSRIGRDPKVDWVFIVLITCVLIIWFVLVGIRKFANFDSLLQQKVSATNAKVSASIDTVSLDNVLNRFEKRRLDRVEAMGDYSGASDPSL